MSNANASLADYSRLYCDPKNWQRAITQLPDNLKDARPRGEEIEQNLQQEVIEE